MDLKKLKKIVNSELPQDVVEYQIIDCLAKDPNVIPAIMQILDRERKQKSEVLQEMNTLLSKAHIGLDEPKTNKDKFMQKEIVEFYKKYKDIEGVGHCFKNLDKLEQNEEKI